MLHMVWILLRGVQESLLMALHERGADSVKAINDGAANRLAAKRVREVMAILDAV